MLASGDLSLALWSLLVRSQVRDVLHPRLRRGALAVAEIVLPPNTVFQLGDERL
jgi:hypothetical protein